MSFLLATSAMAEDLELLMPNVRPKSNDTYLCYEVNLKDTIYITGFKPKANMNVAHHILLFGCAKSNGMNKPWQCSEMQSTSTDFEVGPVCKSPSNIIYAWGMDAPELKLPDDVGFKVGGNTKIKSIVVQVHYKDVSAFQASNDKKDNSGVVLTTTTKPKAKTAGVFLLGTTGEIPAHSTTYMETACQFDQPLTLHPFAYRAHSHEHGKVVSGYRVRDGQWTEIGRVSPQKPQMFYPVTTPDITVTTGDILAARCTMVNNENRIVKIGPTVHDEMCNFYMMYFIEGDHVVNDPICFSQGPPSWKWSDVDEINFQNAPKSASLVPDTDTILEESANEFGRIGDVISRQRQMMNNNLMKMQQKHFGNDLGSSLYKMKSSLWDKPLWNEQEADGDVFDNPSILDQYVGSESDVPFYSREPERFNGFDKPLFNSDSFNDQQQEDANVNEPSFDDEYRFPSLPDIEIPETERENPIETERVSIINDKNGGKGFEATKHVYKNMDGPGRKGYYSATHKETQYSYDSSRDGNNQ